MVATVLGLKFRVIRHQFAREWWRALLVVGGAVWSLSLLPATFWIQQNLAFQPAAARTSVFVAMAGVLLVGWIVVPLLVTGMEDTLDPGRFATLGISARRLMPGLTAAAALTVPFLFFCVVFVILAGAWRWHGPMAVALSAVGGVLTVCLFALASRLAVAWSVRAFSTARTRAVAMGAIAAVVAMAGWGGWLALRDGVESALTYEVPSILRWLEFTPIGAGVSAPRAYELGGLTDALGRLAIVAAAVVVLHLAWRDSVARTLVSPRHRGGGVIRRSDVVLARARTARLLPPSWRAHEITRAVRVRSLVYWFTDPRYLVNAIGVGVLPVVFFAIAMPVLGLPAVWALAVPVILAASIGWGRHNDVAYESTALWTDVVAGRIGRRVMAGRLQAVLCWAVPVLAAVGLAALAWSGRWDALPALLGACVGALGVTLGISAVSSVLLPYRAPQPGANPFGAEVGSVGASMLAQFASSAVTLAALPLVIVPFVLTLAWTSAWGWVSLTAGICIGVAVAWAGTRAAGALYDRKSGRLLAAVS